VTDLTPNIPEVVAEVSILFERYEQALIDKNVEVLDATFWNSPHTIRLANAEHGYGFDRIHAFRVARPPGPGTKEKRLRLDVVTLGRDIATVTLVYKVRGREMTGRQTQTWIRFPYAGWKVIHAHVSMITEPPAICATCSPSTVTTGMSAFFRLCFSTITRSRSPFAHAVRT